MTDAQKAAYVIAQASSAICEAAAMHAANQEREHHGLAMAYVESDFLLLPDKYGLGHNTILSLFHDC